MNIHGSAVSHVVIAPHAVSTTGRGVKHPRLAISDEVRQQTELLRAERSSGRQLRRDDYQVERQSRS